MSEIEISDIDELLLRINEYSLAFKCLSKEPPLFRLTPYEHRIFTTFLISRGIPCGNFFGDLPIFCGVSFELVGKPLLFNGEHIRSDSGIKFNEETKCVK